MTDSFRGMTGALGGDAYRARDFAQHAEQAMQIANDTAAGGWPFSDIDSALARRIVAGEYIGRHEGAVDDSDRPSGPARYAAKPGPFDVPKRRHLRLAQQRIVDAVRRSQP